MQQFCYRVSHNPNLYLPPTDPVLLNPYSVFPTAHKYLPSVRARSCRGPGRRRQQQAWKPSPGHSHIPAGSTHRWSGTRSVSSCWHRHTKGRKKTDSEINAEHWHQADDPCTHSSYPTLGLNGSLPERCTSATMTHTKDPVPKAQNL